VDGAGAGLATLPVVVPCSAVADEVLATTLKASAALPLLLPPPQPLNTAAASAAATDRASAVEPWEDFGRSMGRWLGKKHPPGN
jgi:hypothetical protein